MFDNIHLDPHVKKDNIFITHAEKEICFEEINQKTLYEESDKIISTIHHSQAKWVVKLDLPISWDEVWNAVHNPLTTNQTKSIIWQQILLYTIFI